IDENNNRDLEADYLFLRRIEHFLQLLEDRQVHMLPRKGEELTALAHRIEGESESAEKFMERIESTMARVRSIYESLLPS
ncbi:MAG: hypothetical protein HN368_12275, partial [Spirochaetales bacterium]|nr:hypothetical protein [Spirochaetales bacterium]